MSNIAIEVVLDLGLVRQAWTRLEIMPPPNKRSCPADRVGAEAQALAKKAP